MQFVYADLWDPTICLSESLDKMREYILEKMAYDQVAAAEPSLRPSCTAVWSPSWHLDCTEYRKQVDWNDPPFIPAGTTSYSKRERALPRAKERRKERK